MIIIMMISVFAKGRQSDTTQVRSCPTALPSERVGHGMRYACNAVETPNKHGNGRKSVEPVLHTAAAAIAAVAAVAAVAAAAVAVVAAVAAAAAAAAAVATLTVQAAPVWCV